MNTIGKVIKRGISAISDEDVFSLILTLKKCQESSFFVHLMNTLQFNINKSIIQDIIKSI